MKNADQARNSGSDAPILSRDAVRVRMLFQLVPRSTILNCIVVCLVVLALWQDTNPTTLFIWLSVALTVTMARLALCLAYRWSPTAHHEPMRWENRFALGAGAMGLVWAYLALLGPLSPAYDIFVLLIIGGTAMSSAGILGASVRSFVCFVTPMLAAQFIERLLAPGALNLYICLLVALFTFALVASYKEFRRALLTSITSEDENVTLHRQLRKIFESVSVGVAFARKHRIVDCNQQLAELLDLTRDAVIGTSTGDYLDDDATRILLAQERDETLAARQIYKREMTLRSASGRQIICDVTINALVPGDSSQGMVIILNDLTAQLEREQQWRRTLLKEDAIFATAPVGISFLRDRRLVDFNDAMTQLFGYSREELIGSTLEILYPSHERWETRWRGLEAAFSSQVPGKFEEEFHHKNGKSIWCQVNAAALTSGDITKNEAISVLTDITDRKDRERELRESRETLILIVRSMQGGIWDQDLRTNETILSGRFKEILGYSVTTDPAEIKHLRDRLHPDDLERVLTALERHFAKEAPFNLEYRLRKADDTYVWVQGGGHAVWDEAGTPVRFVGSITDISDRVEKAAEVERMALHDSLTGLPNRRLLEDRLNQAIAIARRAGNTVAVMLIDLDGFKPINDLHGHDAGDDVLKVIAQRLTTAFHRQSDTVARLGGDEFVVVLQRSMDEEIEGQVKQLLKNLGTPIRLRHVEIEVGASIGIAIAPRDADTPAEILRLADKAMYRAKMGTGSSYSFYAS